MKPIRETHPLTCTLYFLTAISAGLIAGDIAVMVLSLLSALIVQRHITGRARVVLPLIIALISALINPFFSHNGETALFMLNGNAVTLEALLYGLNMGLMIGSALTWFDAFTHLMTGDRVLCVCGILSNRLALMISMAMRYVPLLKRQARAIRDARKVTGRYRAETAFDKMREGLTVFSSLVTWALENGITTADSMTARGYDTGRRTQFNDYFFGKHDALLTAIIAVLLGSVIALKACGLTGTVYYPGFITSGIADVCACAAMLLIGLLPILNDAGYKLKWKSLTSKI